MNLCNNIYNVISIMSMFQPDSIPSDMREIGHEAVWSLSTAKPGNGVEQLRDNNSDTYWQSMVDNHIVLIYNFIKK